MVKLNGEEVEWKKAPNFENNVQRKIIWKDEESGALFALMKIPKGTLIEDLPHCHPKSGQITFHLSGEAVFPDGSKLSIGKDDYRFSYCPKGEMHGHLKKGSKILEDIIYLHYWDGSDEWGE
ncbi:hypothetical protein GF319_09675 [Candidatus Bathyarchaeota archaeon]|nr:hypothetical protein [Candidatus Bathyarchaeota archaeon]